MSSSTGGSERWTLRRVLTEKLRMGDQDIDELFSSADADDLVELVIELQERFGIEISNDL